MSGKNRKRPSYSPTYLRKLAHPGLVHMTMKHEADCAHWAGRDCSCSPDVSITGDVAALFATTQQKN